MYERVSTLLSRFTLFESSFKLYLPEETADAMDAGSQYGNLMI